jgi:hypothetical protein
MEFLKAMLTEMNANLKSNQAKAAKMIAKINTNQEKAEANAKATKKTC